MAASDAEFERAYARFYKDVITTLTMESALAGKGPLRFPKPRGRKVAANPAPMPTPHDAVELAAEVVENMRQARKRARPRVEEDVSDEALSKYARFTDKLKLVDYRPFLHLVPRLVNVVTVSAVAIPAHARPLTRRRLRSWQRPYPFPEAAPSCRSTCTGSPPAAPTPTTPPSAFRRCSWPTRSRAAEC